MTATTSECGLPPALVTQGPAWMAARRRAAWDAFTVLPIPSSKRDEDWRRTDIAGLDVDSFRPVAADADYARHAAAARARRDRGAPEAAFVMPTPGGLGECVGADMLIAQGVIVSSLQEAATRHPEQVQRAMATVGVGESKFLALWNAGWQGGCFIYVPRAVQAQVPVWIAHAPGGDGVVTFPATLVLLDDDASLTLIEDYFSGDDHGGALGTAVTASVIGRRARMDHCQIQQWNKATWHFETTRSEIAEGGRLRFFGATFGSRLQKACWEALLVGEGAEAELAGVCFGDGSQHLDHQTLQAHRAPNTRSDLLLKVAVRDMARSVYSGLIDVAPDAQHTNGYVQNRNLLLNHGAKADSVPRLEIRANDVRCGHGTTAGHIDDDQRLYLMARGIPAHEANELIVRGFMDDALTHVPHHGVADLIGTLLGAAIAGPDGASPDGAGDAGDPELKRE